MRINFVVLCLLGLLTCHKESDGKANSPLSCFAQDVAEGVELVCDGVPHLIRHGKDGKEGAAGHNGSPGAKGDQGPAGASGRSVKEVINCHEDWDGVPAYSIDYLVFTYSDDIRESISNIETDKGEIFTNSAIWLKDDKRYSKAPLDNGGFSFTLTAGGALVLYRGNGRTSDMNCH